MSWRLSDIVRHGVFVVVCFLGTLLGFATTAKADLSLDLEVSTQSPFAFDPVEITITIQNAGTTAATGVIAQLNLGNGIVLATADDSRFDPDTGRWTVGTLNAGATEQILIAAAVLDQGDFTITSEISEATITDPDSTPGNFATSPGEDDDESITLITRAQLTGVIPASACATTASEFDWATTGWVGGFLGPDTFLGDRTRFTVSFSGNVEHFQAAYPRIHSLSSFGDPSTISTMYLFMDYDTLDDQVSMTINFSNPISEFNWRMFDVDKGQGSWTDEVTITGALNGNTIIPILVAASDAVSVSGNTATGRRDVDNEQGDANVSMYFGGPVDTITISYQPGFDSPVVPQQQLIAFDVISYCRPNINSSDLSLTASVSTSEVELGSTADMIWTLSNDGPELAQNVTADLNLPENLTVVDVSGEGTFDAATGIWTLESDVNVGDTRQLVLRVQPNAVAQFTSIGEVNSSDSFDVDSVPADRLSDPDQDDTTTVTLSATLRALDVVETGSALCEVVGGTLGANVLALADGGSFGTGSGATDDLATSDIFSELGTSGTYRSQLADLQNGGFAYVSNLNTDYDQIITPVVDPQGGTDGRYLLVAERTADPRLLIDTTFQPTASNGFFEVSFLALNLADPETGNTSDVVYTIEIDGVEAYRSSSITSSDQPNWQRIGATISTGTSTASRNIRILAQSTSGAFDVALDSARFSDCSLQSAAVSGTIYQQITDDGVLTDGVETGYSQPVTVTLPAVLDDGGSLQTPVTSTDGSGGYLFSNLLPTIDYQVVVDFADEDLPNNASAATPHPLAIANLVGGETRTNNDVGFTADLIDLALTSGFSNTDVSPGNDTILNVTLQNEGDTDASDVTVEVELPSGLVYVSDDTGGLYDPDTGLWTVGAVSAGAQDILQLTVRRVDPSELLAISEIASAGTFDVDSTPSNRTAEPNEDDTTQSSIPAGSSGLNTLARSCAAPSPFIDWALSGLQTGSVESQRIANADVGATISFSGRVEQFVNDTPRIGFDFPAGGLSSEQKLILFFDDTGEDATVTTSMAFDEPVRDIQFTINDIDSRGLNGVDSAGYRDQVVLRAFDANNSPLEVFLSSGPLVAIFGDNAVGTQDISNTSSDGDLTVLIPGETSRVEIDYQPVRDFRVDPISQAIAIADFSYCEDAIADMPSLSPDHERLVQAGTFVHYPHVLSVPDTFVGSPLSFAFESSENIAWTLYQDIDGDQLLGDADVVWSNGAALPDERTSFLAVGFVPQTVPEGWLDQTTITASLTGADGNTSLTVQDVTRVLRRGTQVAGRKSVAIDQNCDGSLSDETTADAEFQVNKTIPPGACALFQISFANEGTLEVTEVAVRDPIPSFTSFIEGSARFDVIPDGMAADGIVLSSAPEEVIFSLSGTFNPGAQGQVTYGVRVDE